MILDELGPGWLHPSLPGARLHYHPSWLDADEAGRIQQALIAELPWTRHRVRLFGRELDAPRLSAWVGDPGVSYRYSGVRHDPAPWTQSLSNLRSRLERELGIEFNSVLANRYRDGSDSMGWHADDERELGAQPTIASISLGATRRFRLKPRSEAGTPLALDLVHGSLLVMAGGTQTNYMHALPRSARVVGERINLTFRWVGGA